MLAPATLPTFPCVSLSGECPCHGGFVWPDQRSALSPNVPGLLLLLEGSPSSQVRSPPFLIPTSHPAVYPSPPAAKGPISMFIWVTFFLCSTTGKSPSPNSGRQGYPSPLSPLCSHSPPPHRFLTQHCRPWNICSGPGPTHMSAVQLSALVPLLLSPPAPDQDYIKCLQPWPP